MRRLFRPERLAFLTLLACEPASTPEPAPPLTQNRSPRWPALEEVARRENLKLASPAVNYCGDCVSEGGVTFSDPVSYLDAFFAACTGCKVDYIAVHWYACDVSALKWYIGRFKKYDKPIWLTEFACGDKPHDQI